MQATNRTSCKRCNSLRTNRLARQSYFERYIAPFFGLYPWKCRDCRHSFLVRRRGERHHYRLRDQSNDQEMTSELVSKESD